jgi:hypothetical protein
MPGAGLGLLTFFPALSVLECDGMNTENPSVLKTWVIIGLLVAFILGKGWLSFAVVGDLGQPDWDFRPVPDVPGESVYAIYPAQPHAQHVRGSMGE